MTDIEKQRIAEMRAEGKGYTIIAEELGQSLSNIRSYCRRHDLGGIRSSAETRAFNPDCCESCGKPVRQVAGRKHKRFCSDACRMKWWARHRNKIQHKTVRIFTCLKCGAQFEVYP